MIDGNARSNEGGYGPRSDLVYIIGVPAGFLFISFLVGVCVHKRKRNSKAKKKRSNSSANMTNKPLTSNGNVAPEYGSLVTEPPVLDIYNNTHDGNNNHHEACDFFPRAPTHSLTPGLPLVPENLETNQQELPVQTICSRCARCGDHIGKHESFFASTTEPSPSQRRRASTLSDPPVVPTVTQSSSMTRHYMAFGSYSDINSNRSCSFPHLGAPSSAGELAQSYPPPAPSSIGESTVQTICEGHSLAPPDVSPMYSLRHSSLNNHNGNIFRNPIDAMTPRLYPNSRRSMRQSFSGGQSVASPSVLSATRSVPRSLHQQNTGNILTHQQRIPQINHPYARGELTPRAVSLGELRPGQLEQVAFQQGGAVKKLSSHCASGSSEIDLDLGGHEEVQFDFMVHESRINQSHNSGSVTSAVYAALPSAPPSESLDTTIFTPKHNDSASLPVAPVTPSYRISTKQEKYVEQFVDAVEEPTEQQNEVFMSPTDNNSVSLKPRTPPPTPAASPAPNMLNVLPIQCDSTKDTDHHEQ